MDKPDPKPIEAKGVARLTVASGGGEELVTRGLLVSSCRICEPAVDGEFASEEERQAACGGTIETTCCPEDLFPETVYMTVSGAGACDGTYPLTWNTSAWAGDGGTAFGGPNLGECNISTFALTCESGVFKLAIGLNIAVYDAVSVDCATRTIVFSGFSFASCCVGGGSATVTITPTAP